MFGVSANGKDAIVLVVEKMFDRLAMLFVGDIPRLRNSKNILFSYMPSNGLAGLFVQSIGNRSPNLVERDVMRSLLTSADGHIQGLKAITGATVTERVDALAREARIQGRSVNMEEVEKIISEEMAKAKIKMQIIAEAESTKFRNMGSMVDIAKVAASQGETDPTVFFILTKDGSTCKECIRLHLMSDQVTPRLWKLSELKQGWHKRGEETPCVSGLHPHCRCALTMLASGWSFNSSGLIEYKEQGHDELQVQRD